MANSSAGGNGARGSIGARLRCAGVTYRACVLYRALQTLDFIDYSEVEPAEAGYLLHQKKVDLALIPISDFALHGGYVGLDFGFGCREESLLRLCTRDTISETKRVYLTESASGSAYLLNLLTRERWFINPELVRVGDGELPAALGPGEAILLRASDSDPMKGAYPLSIDLVRAWHEWIGDPFMFLIWSSRPGALTIRQQRQFREVCLRATTAELQSTVEPNEPQPFTAPQYREYVRRNYCYYFDVAERAGLAHFYSRAAKSALLPLAEYRHATQPLISGRPSPVGPKRSVTEILDAAVHGQRLSIREGLRIVRRAHIAELGLAIEVIRARWGKNRDFRNVFTPTMDELRSGFLNDESREIQETRPDRVRLPIVAELPVQGTLERWIAALPANLAAPQELCLVVDDLGTRALSVEMLEQGLRTIAEAGVALLRLKVVSLLGAHEAVRIARRASACGLRLTVGVGPLALEDWEERLLVLQVLRSLQDESRCFESFGVDGSSTDIDALLRYSMLGQLFLDNIALVQELRATIETGGSVLRAAVGVQRVDVLYSRAEVAQLGMASRFLQSLDSAALSFVHQTTGKTAE